MSYKNNVLCKLNEDISSVDDIIHLEIPEAPYNTPDLDGGTLVLADSSGLPTKLEIITYFRADLYENVVTLRGCVRGLEGTIGRAWTSLDVCYQAVTAKTLADIDEAIAGRVENDTGGALKASDLAQLGDQVNFGQVDIADIKLEKSSGLLRFSEGINVPSLRINGVNITVGGGKLIISHEVEAIDFGRTE